MTLSQLGNEILNAAKKTGETGAGYTAANAETLPIIVGRVINVILATSGIILLALIVYGGYIWMTSQGEKEDVDKAQKILRSAIIGLVIMFLAWGITQFVISRLITAAVNEI